MGWFSGNKSNDVQWVNLTSIEQLNEIYHSSSEKPVLLFKHSTRCSISHMAFSGFERQWEGSDEMDLYYLDLLKFRDVSDEIAKLTGVIHQSPQVIVLKDKEVIYTATHSGISARAALNAIH